MSLPERINVMKVVTYDVERLVADIRECWAQDERANDEVVLEDVLAWISDWVEDDFSCGCGRRYADTSSLIYQDENGEEIA